LVVSGGRVRLGETRAECGLGSDRCTITELITADVILSDDRGRLRHAVSTVFRIEMSGTASPLELDEHTEAAEWRFPGDWLRENLFVRRLVATEIDRRKRATPSPRSCRSRMRGNDTN
jgi:hypothetical protein